MGNVWPKAGVERLEKAMGDLSSMPPQLDTTLSIGRLNPSIYIVPLKRTHPDSDDWADANWFDARITIRAGMFHGDYAACLRSDEVELFCRDVEKLLSGAAQVARFESVEQWLSIDVTAVDKLGHFRAVGVARDDVRSSNQLRFAIDTDQADVAELKVQLEGCLRHFPVVGTPIGS